jgi:hypothetical protein
MQTRTLSIVAAGALGVAVGCAGLLLAERATAAPPAPPLQVNPIVRAVSCPATMSATTGGWQLSSGPWKPLLVTPPGAAAASQYGPFMKTPDGSYELPGGAAIPTYTWNLSGVFAEPFQRILKCEYAGSGGSAPFASLTVTQPWPRGQECTTSVGPVNARTFQCQ